MGAVSPQQPLDDLEMSAWHSMLRAHASVVRRLEAELTAEHGLSLPAYEVLSHLSDVPDRSLRMTELSEAALLSPSGVTRLVVGGNRIDRAVGESGDHGPAVGFGAPTSTTR